MFSDLIISSHVHQTTKFDELLWEHICTFKVIIRNLK